MTDWPVEGRNPARMSSISARASVPSAIAWSFDPGTVSGSGPVIGSGACYFTNLDGAVYAVDIRTGRVRWQARVGRTFSTPALWQGRLLVGSDNAYLVALDATTGRELWTFVADGGIRTSLVVSGGSVFFSGEDFFAVRIADGSLIWRSKMGWIAGMPAIVRDTLLACEQGSRLKALDLASGVKRWETPLNDTIVSGLTVSEGQIFLGNEFGVMQALDSRTGKRLWSFPTRGFVPSPPAFADGTIYVGSTDGLLYALSAETGRERWRISTGRSIQSAPLIVGHWIAVGGVDGAIHIADAATGRELRRLQVGGSVQTQPAFGEDHLLVRADKLYAFRR
jgi:outer membrane protein assembly factor BamB